MNYTPQQRLQRGRMALMGHKTWALYSGLLMMGKMEIRAGLPTACTNGRDVWFGEAFIESLTDPELRFVFLHETEHKALRQLSTYKFLWDKNANLCNQAADYVVNIRLKDADADEGFIQMPKVGLIDAKYRGWSTKQVFEDLEKQEENPSGGFDEHDFEGAEALSQEEKETLGKEIDSAIRQGKLLAGKMGGDRNRMLDDVLESQIRWQEILAEFVKSVTKGRDNASWSKLNRRFVSSGLYLPSSISESVGSLLVGIDASGSTWSGNQLEGFISELIGIANECQPEGIDVVWWDTKVQSVQSFKPPEYPTMKLNLEIKGGGGTTPSCVTDWIKATEQVPNNYVAAVMLSDGLVGNDWGDWGDLSVLWCLNRRGVTSPVGQTLYICE